MDTQSPTQRVAARYDDGLARGMELALVPVVSGAIGYGLDRVFGLVPVLTIAAVLFGIVGMFVRSYYRYEAEMQAHEADAAWSTTAGRAKYAMPARRRRRAAP